MDLQVKILLNISLFGERSIYHMRGRSTTVVFWPGGHFTTEIKILSLTGSCHHLWITVCDIGSSLDMTWINVNCVFQENISSVCWYIFFFQMKNISFQFSYILYAHVENTFTFYLFDPKYFV